MQNEEVCDLAQVNGKHFVMDGHIDLHAICEAASWNRDTVMRVLDVLGVSEEDARAFSALPYLFTPTMDDPALVGQLLPIQYPRLSVR